MLQPSFLSTRLDFARVLAQKFGLRRVLIIGATQSEMEHQCAAAGIVAKVYPTARDLNGATAVEEEFEQAIWFYSDNEMGASGTSEIDMLAQRVNEVLLIPSATDETAKTRPQIVEHFGRHGFVPDYDCDLSELAPGTIRLRREQSQDAEHLVPAAESAFARLHLQLRNLQRTLRTRMVELEAADRHIAKLEEKILALREANREIKKLKQEKQALRKSPERRVGQVLLAPYRLPQKLFRALRGPGRAKRVVSAQSAGAAEYQAWFERHRATPEQLEAMRAEARQFSAQPLFSIITPVFNTPVKWLEEAVKSVCAQAYENWQLVLVDDASTDAAFREFLAKLQSRDSRINVFKLDQHGGISVGSNYALQHARGEWIGILDHDDLLEPDALFHAAKLLQENANVDIIYSDEDKLTEVGLDRPHFKPDWSPDYFLSYNYLCHFTIFRRSLAEKAGGFRPEFDGSQDYDLFLRMTEQTDRIHHIPRVLYHWRRTENSLADNIRRKPGALEAGRRAIEQHLQRSGEHAHVTIDWRTHCYWVKRELGEAKKISIIIPVRDRIELLARCIESITAKTSYPNYEIVVVDNDSRSEEARAYFNEFKHRLLYFEGPFNYSAINNFAVEQTDSPWLLFLNNDMEVIEGDWLNFMAEHIQRPQIGAVGARLLYPDDTIQHAGVVLGVGGIGTHAFRGFPAEDPGVVKQLQVTRNYSCVTGACLLTRRDVFTAIGGFDEERLPVTFNDVDLCLKIGRAGYRIIYTPFAKLYHHESASRRRTSVEAPEAEVIRERWPDLLERDPYYNPNLSGKRADFSLGK